ncbi:MAG: hypothetical protein WCO38_09480 [Verrucomicrobiota bacterium]
MTPYLQYKKGVDLLHLGHYQAGFRLYEFRWHPLVLQATGERWDKWVKAPKWNGERLFDKHIVVQMEQGFGDIIQFCRFLPMLKSWGAKKLTVMTHKSLMPLLGQMDCIDVITDDRSVDIEADYWIGSMSLPHFATYAPPFVKQSFPVNTKHIVGSEGYLDAIPSGIEHKVGVNWSASTGPLHYVKSIPLDTLRSLVGDDVYSIHVQLDDVFDPLPNDGWKQDFYKTACHMKAMKAVVAPDTATAHLAGALGVKCFLMLPDDQFICWRWKNATWYDSVVPLKKSEWHTLPRLLEEL